MLLDSIYLRREDGRTVVICTVQAHSQHVSHISTPSSSQNRETKTTRTVLWLSTSSEGGQERMMIGGQRRDVQYQDRNQARNILQTPNKLRLLIISSNPAWH
jgi:hypothetical protein